jgi:hypothetical protein
MSMIATRCPQTGRAIATGIETDRSTFEELPDIPGKFRCPACGSQHEWCKSEAWLADYRIITNAA